MINFKEMSQNNIIECVHCILVGIDNANQNAMGALYYILKDLRNAPFYISVNNTSLTSSQLQVYNSMINREKIDRI